MRIWWNRWRRAMNSLFCIALDAVSSGRCHGKKRKHLSMFIFHLFQQQKWFPICMKDYTQYRAVYGYNLFISIYSRHCISALFSHTTNYIPYYTCIFIFLSSSFAIASCGRNQYKKCFIIIIELKSRMPTSFCFCFFFCCTHQSTLHIRAIFCILNFWKKNI